MRQLTRSQSPRPTSPHEYGRARSARTLALTAGTAALDTTPEFWTNLQTAYDLARSRPSEPVQRLAAVSWSSRS